jgi:ferredoxin
MKERVFSRDRWECVHCGKRVTSHSAQLAHLIPQRKHLIRRYGKEIIYHKKNLVTVCGLRCNNAVQVNAPELQELIARGVRESREGESA